jgi:histone H3/H4
MSDAADKTRRAGGEEGARKGRRRRAGAGHVLSDRGGGEPYADIKLKGAVQRYVREISLYVQDEPESAENDQEQQAAPARVTGAACQVLDGVANDALAQVLQVVCQVTARDDRKQIKARDVLDAAEQMFEPEIARRIKARILDVLGDFSDQRKEGRAAAEGATLETQ